MPHRQHRRPTATRRTGDDRAGAVARRIGLGLRDSRVALRLTQAQAGRRASISQSAWSRIERGTSAAASLETLAACAAAVESQLAAFIEARPGSTLPRDVEHLRRQELVIAIARAGGWAARPELPIDPGAIRSRSIDVDLVRRGGAEEVVVEIEDLLTDGGAALRNLADKVAAIRRAAASGTAVRGLVIVRATRRNRDTIGAFPAVFASRFPGSSAAWLRALTDPAALLPDEDGLLWSSARGDRLMAVRLLAQGVPR
jgi:transcriptional regulator with XRE-family HTH domain